MTTALIYHPDYLKHDTGSHPEKIARLDGIMTALQSDTDLWDSLLHLTPDAATEEDILRCHTSRHFDSVVDACEREGHLDADTVVVRGSFDAGMRAVGGGIAAVDAVVSGRARNAFVAVRPPGHHATPDRPMGFCLFNNIAIAARYAQGKLGIDRVLIIDWDVHHGNGTQDIFYEDPSVFFFSMHQSPWYPGTGAYDERGSGKGEDKTMNLPLRAGTPAATYRELFKEKLEKITADFQPELFLISAGFDSHIRDPLGHLMLEDDDFASMTKQVLDLADKRANGRVVAMLEGGYNLATLGETVRRHISALG